VTIHLPNDLENSVQKAVHNGRFASVDDAMAAAVRLLLREIEQEPAAMQAKREANGGLGSIGAMHDDAELLDQAVEHAMKVREERPWRIGQGE
jgi:Arc/MetJ-type ribon-helix-helix transcriptional regulator